MIGEAKSAVKGVKFTGGQGMTAVSKMRLGDVVQVRRETDPGVLKYDQNAVELHYLGVRVGYVAREANPPVARALDAGIAISASVIQLPEYKAGKLRQEPLVLLQW